MKIKIRSWSFVLFSKPSGRTACRGREDSLIVSQEFPVHRCPRSKRITPTFLIKLCLFSSPLVGGGSLAYFVLLAPPGLAGVDIIFWLES